MSKINQICAPNNNKNTISCFDNKALENIINSYNQYFQDDKITISGNITDKNREDIWKQIKSKFQEKFNCDNEVCWIEKAQFIKNKEEYLQYFKPKKPSEWIQEPEKWLSTLDIEAILSQYMKKYKDFYFVGAVPMDFDTVLNIGICVVESLCKINLSKLYAKGIRKIGIVFNLDPHYKSGSHWVALYMDFATAGIYYFDSYGTKPPTEVVNLMNRLQQMGNDLIFQNKINHNDINDEHKLLFNIKSIDNNKVYISDSTDKVLNLPTYFSNTENVKLNETPSKITTHVNPSTIIMSKNPDNSSIFMIQKGFRKFYNNVRFQYKFSECGVYSIHFIVQFLLGYTFKEIISNIIDDDTINGLRNHYYRTI